MPLKLLYFSSSTHYVVCDHRSLPLAIYYHAVIHSVISSNEELQIITVKFLRLRGNILTLNLSLMLKFTSCRFTLCCTVFFFVAFLSRSNFHQQFIMVCAWHRVRKKMCALEQDHFFYLFLFFCAIQKPVRQPARLTKKTFLNLRFAQLIVKRRILRCFCHFLLLVTRAKARQREEDEITSETACTLHAPSSSTFYLFRSCFSSFFFSFYFVTYCEAS